MSRIDIRTIKKYLCICAALLCLCGCHEALQSDMEKTASVQLVLNAPTYGLEMRSVSSDPDDPQEWTSWERAVDGRYLYRVTAFILQGNRLVAHQDISLDNEAQKAVLDFEANFTHGSYTLMVVANYSEYQAEDGAAGVKTYNGLGDFTSTVEEILKYGSIDDFKELYASSFLNYRISSVGGVCARVPQPLTLVKEIELHPGTNVISGELLRTYSRVRITVENNSDEELYLSSMSFSNIFTQKSAYLFATQGYIQDRTSIDVTNSNSILPFIGTESVPVTIPAKGSDVVFDAYILESQRVSSSESYTYTLGLGYDKLNSYTLKTKTAITKKSNLTSGYYLIYNTNSSTYLRAGSNSVAASKLQTLTAGMSISKDYVWTLDNTGLSADQYYIGTADALNVGETSYFMSNPSSSSVALGANKSVYFTAADKSSYITLRSSGSGNYRYLYINSGSVLGRNSSNNSCLFSFYPIDVPASSRVEVPVNTIDNVTGQSIQMTEICRNDFINAVVKVSYSKNQGHFSFEVKEWGTAGGDVSFN